MTYLILLFRLKLGRRELAAGRLEDRIVAEASTAARHLENAPFPAALGRQGIGIRSTTHQDDDAAVARSAPLGRHAAQLPEQFLEIRAIACALARIARRMHAGASPECIHLDAGIICERRQSGCAGGVARLDERILEERSTAFDDCIDAQRGLRQHLILKRSQQRAELAQLADVCARENESSHAPYSACDCRANSRPMPAAARSSSASSSWRRKACPSAVP